MKVLLATAYFDTHRGGIELVAGRLARELAAIGVSITWLATDAIVPAAGSANVPVKAWNVSERRFGVPFPLPSWSGLTTVWRQVRSHDVLMLHDSLYLTNVVAMIAARRHRKPVVLVQHIAAVPYTSTVLRVLMRFANRVVARPMLRSADQVVFISATVARHFDGVRFKAEPRLVFNGVDTHVFTVPAPAFDRAATRTSLRLPIDRPIALFVGRFVEKKGLHAIERLARLRPDLTFALAGWGVIDPADWKLPNVHVLSGLQEDSLVPLYQASDVFILPSIGEGLPLVMQEALACGLPVICGRETASADPLAGQLITAADVDQTDADKTAGSFASKLVTVLAGTMATDARIRAKGRHDYVAARYSWAESANVYRSIMSDMVGPQSGGARNANHLIDNTSN
jgi:glycosyltransferase involved in cell wall biosynthesis